MLEQWVRNFFVTGLRRKKWQVPKLQSSLPMQNITGVEHCCSNQNVHINLCSVDKGTKWAPLWKHGEVRWREVVMRSTLSAVASDANRPTFKIPGTHMELRRERLHNLCSSDSEAATGNWCCPPRDEHREGKHWSCRHYRSTNRTRFIVNVGTN